MKPPTPRPGGGHIVRPPPRTGPNARRHARQATPQADGFRWWRGWPATLLLLIAASVFVYIALGLWWAVKH